MQRTRHLPADCAPVLPKEWHTATVTAQNGRFADDPGVPIPSAARRNDILTIVPELTSAYVVISSRRCRSAPPNTAGRRRRGGTRRA